MANIEVSKAFDADAETVWRTIGDPAGVAAWIPALAQAHMDDDIRHVVFTDGQPARERIVAHSDSDRSYTYQYIDGPLPLEHYESTISVVDLDGAGSKVSWSAEFRAASPQVEAELNTGIGEIYSGALEELSTQLSA